MRSDDELLDRLGRALAESTASPSVGPRQEDVARLRKLADEASARLIAPVVTLESKRRRAGFVTAAAVVAAFALGTMVRRDDGGGSVAVGVVEFQQNIVFGDDGRAAARVIGRRVGIGRVVEIRSDDLPILPKGELYEVWFVADNDTPGVPNRISAGTFHPDESGRTVVSLTAAVDPAKYPVLAITAEAGDGNPAPSATEVLRDTLTVIG